MCSFKVLFCIAFGLLVLSTATEAACNACSATSYAACINETSFVVCFDGQTPSERIETCRENTVCTDTKGVCQPKDPGVILGCSPVGKCNYCGNAFACVSQTQYAFCTEDGNFGHVATCEQGKFCRVSQYAATGQICHLSCVAEPTCQNTEPELPPEEIWRESCNSVTTTGDYINIHDNTCTTYVYCEALNNVMNAVKYKCPAGYFDADSQTCSGKIPIGCS